MTNRIHARVTVALNEEEYAELYKIAQRELRDPRDQIRYILRCALFGEPIRTSNANQPIPDGDPQHGESTEDS